MITRSHKSKGYAKFGRWKVLKNCIECKSLDFNRLE